MGAGLRGDDGAGAGQRVGSEPVDGVSPQAEGAADAARVAGGARLRALIGGEEIASGGGGSCRWYFFDFFREGAHKMEDFLHLYMRGQEAPDKMKGGV